ncbi:hypothetical protein VTH06DRAFT_2063 [Thermothelomyces fergusii]
MASSSAPPTPLLYACIAHKTTVLAECSAPGGPQASALASLASLVLSKIDHASPQKLTYTHGAHHIHYVAASPSEYPPAQATAGGLTYLAVSDAAAAGGRRLSFAFLAELRARFLAAHPPEATDFSDLPDYGCAGFAADMGALMARFAATAAAAAASDDALGSVRREIDDVRGVMTRNIEGLLERGERIDLLVDKTDRLGQGASEFRVRSRGLKRKMWWKNVKLMALLGLVLVLILVTIVVSARG